MATQRICSIPDCGKPHKGHGWCAAHHQRWRKFGDPLAPKIGAGKLQDFLRDVVDQYVGAECLMWPFPTKKTYPAIKVNGKDWGFHRYVCHLTNGDPPTKDHEAAHTCGNSLCVNKRHIVWKTHADNLADRVRHGTAPIGERHFNSKLTPQHVREIRRLGRTLHLKTLGGMFGVHGSSIGKILSGKSWAHIKDEED